MKIIVHFTNKAQSVVTAHIYPSYFVRKLMLAYIHFSKCKPSEIIAQISPSEWDSVEMKTHIWNAHISWHFTIAKIKDFYHCNISISSQA